MSNTTTNMGNIQHVIQSIADKYGFLSDTDVEFLASNDTYRLLEVLVRCGNRRFTCAVQYLPGMVEAIEAAGDYVRDVSLPSHSPLWQCAPLKP